MGEGDQQIKGEFEPFRLRNVEHRGFVVDERLSISLREICKMFWTHEPPTRRPDVPGARHILQRFSRIAATRSAFSAFGKTLGITAMPSELGLRIAALELATGKDECALGEINLVVDARP